MGSVAELRVTTTKMVFAEMMRRKPQRLTYSRPRSTDFYTY